MKKYTCNTHAVSFWFHQIFASYEKNRIKEIKAPEMTPYRLTVQVSQYISAVCEYNEEFSNTPYKNLVYSNCLYLL